MANNENQKFKNITKNALEQYAIIDEINKRERKYSSINKVFTLNVKRCKIRNYIKYL